MSNSPYFTATHEWGGQFQHGNWYLTHCMPRKRPIYYDELDEADHTHLFQKSASFLPALIIVLGGSGHCGGASTARDFRVAALP